MKDWSSRSIKNYVIFWWRAQKQICFKTGCKRFNIAGKLPEKSPSNSVWTQERLLHSWDIYFHSFTPNKLQFIGSIISNYTFLHRQKLHLGLPRKCELMLISHARYHLSYMSLSCSSGLFSYLKFQINWKKIIFIDLFMYI